MGTPERQRAMKNYKVLSERLGQRWPRLMPLRFAAAYVGMIDLERFAAICSQHGIKIKEWQGDKVVDKMVLDSFLDNIII